MKNLFLFTLLLLILSSCAVSVESIRKSPESFQNRDVHLKGHILNVKAIPMTSLALYTLYDGSGQLSVLDLRGEAPFAVNQKVSLTGSFFYLGLKGQEHETADFKRFLKKELFQSSKLKKSFSHKLFDLSYAFLTRLLKNHANIMIVVLTK